MLILSGPKTSLHCELIDLTHALDSQVPTWGGHCGYQHRVIVDYAEACRVQEIQMNAGTGTHLDAPSHFIPGAKSASELPLEDLITPVIVIDVSTKAEADYYLSVQDLQDHEKRCGEIPAGTVVLAHTGWDRYWQDPKKYRHADASGQMHFPGFSKESAEFLLERKIKGLGIDTLSPDCLDLNFPVHHLILGEGKYILENLTQLGQLPPVGAYGIFLPIKTAEGTEAVLRAVGLVPK